MSYAYGEYAALNWPTTLRRLEISDWEKWDGVELPSELQEFYCGTSSVPWTTFPDGLKKLTLSPKMATSWNLHFLSCLKS